MRGAAEKARRLARLENLRAHEGAVDEHRDAILNAKAVLAALAVDHLAFELA
jgi:hypothetical protein